jgi:hypothetical protein
MEETNEKETQMRENKANREKREKREKSKGAKGKSMLQAQRKLLA